MKRYSKLWIVMLVATTCWGAVGCSSISNRKDSSWFPWKREDPDEVRRAIPVRMSCIWTPDVLMLPGKPPTRGFGGRIYFYNNRGQTVPVKGELVVYGYDDTGSESQDSLYPGSVIHPASHVQPGNPRGERPADRRFVFRAEKFDEHFSETELGASYSVWVPWDGLGQPQTNVSLLPIFVTSSGGQVVGTLSTSILGGPPRGDTSTDVAKQAAPDSSVAPVSFRTGEGEGTLTANYEEQRQRKGLGLRTYTINLPSATSERLAKLPADVHWNLVPSESPSPSSLTTDGPQAFPTELPAAHQPSSGYSSPQHFGSGQQGAWGARTPANTSWMPPPSSDSAQRWTDQRIERPEIRTPNPSTITPSTFNRPAPANQAMVTHHPAVGGSPQGTTPATGAVDFTAQQHGSNAASWTTPTSGPVTQGDNWKAWTAAPSGPHGFGFPPSQLPAQALPNGQSNPFGAR